MLLLSKTEGRLLYQIQCAYESQQQSTCTQLMKSTNYHVQIAMEYLSTPDFTAIGYVMNSSDCPTQPSLIDCNVNIEAIDAILSEMDDASKDLLQGLHFEVESFDATENLCMNKLLSNIKSLKYFTVTARSDIWTRSKDNNAIVDGDFPNLTQIHVVNVNVEKLGFDVAEDLNC